MWATSYATVLARRVCCGRFKSRRERVRCGVRSHVLTLLATVAWHRIVRVGWRNGPGAVACHLATHVRGHGHATVHCIDVAELVVVGRLSLKCGNAAHSTGGRNRDWPVMRGGGRQRGLVVRVVLTIRASST